MDSPLVSIVIPVYNGSRFIEKAIACIKEQSFKDYELVIVDDGSGDDSYELAINLTKDIINTTIIKKTNEGVSSARNKGIELASGKYIAFLDVDDVWDSSKLEKEINILEVNNHIGLVCTAKRFVNSDKYVGKFSKDVTRNFSSILINKGNFITTSSVIVRRNLIQQFNIKFNPNLNFGEDWLFWILLSQYNDFYFLSEPLIIYNPSPFTKYTLIDYLKFYKTLKNEINNNPTLKEHTNKFLLFSNIAFYEGLIIWKNQKFKSLALLFLALIINPLKIRTLYNAINYR